MVDSGGKRPAEESSLFRVGHPHRIRYDLAVTDPAWLSQLKFLTAGVYPHAFFLED